MWLQLLTCWHAWEPYATKTSAQALRHAVINRSRNDFTCYQNNVADYKNQTTSRWLQGCANARAHLRTRAFVLANRLQVFVVIVTIVDLVNSSAVA